MQKKGIKNKKLKNRKSIAKRRLDTGKLFSVVKRNMYF